MRSGIITDKKERGRTMKKAAITAVGFTLLAVGFMAGVASNIGFAPHVQRYDITVLAATPKYRDIQTDNATLYARE
jgi:hypothetical protein